MAAPSDYAARLVALDESAAAVALDQSRAGVAEVAARFDQGLVVREATAAGVAVDALAETAEVSAKTLYEYRAFCEADLFASDDGAPDRARMLSWAEAAAERAVSDGRRLTYSAARRDVLHRAPDDDPAAKAERAAERHLSRVRSMPCAVCGSEGPVYAVSLARAPEGADPHAVALSSVPLCAKHVHASPSAGLWAALARTLVEMEAEGAGALVVPRHALIDTRAVPADVVPEPSHFADWFDGLFPPSADGRPTWYSPEEVWTGIGVGKDVVYRALDDGRLEGIRLSGRQWIVPRPALRLFLVRAEALNRPVAA